ncbi:MAG: citramalate synthase [Deltaproteobacteria bacterium]|nr:citramalate synthase [Deltaproteobacteria bacterium]
MKPILLYDTTLRDGTQGENINFSAEEKIKIALRLDQIGIHYIEGGWPGSNPRDMRFFELARQTKFKQARIAAFCATRRPGILAFEDPSLKAALDCKTPVVTVFGKTWDLHVEKIMDNTLEENLNMIRESVCFFKERGREVIYDAEHFFDGFKENPEYALRTLFAAKEAGADLIVLCDTNGGTLHHDLESVFRQTHPEISQHGETDVRLGIHAHNDCGLAVANSISAVHAGAQMIQGTINGYGERCGNADLTSIIPILQTKMDRPCVKQEQLSELKKLSRFVSETANMTPNNARPFVGHSAFAHKGGIHVSAVMKQPRAYEHMDPGLVGNRRRVLVSDLSGKSNIEYKAEELGIPLDNGYDSKQIVSEIKNLEQEGYQFDVAEGSLKILFEKYTERFKPLFKLENYRISMEKDKDNNCWAHATVKVSVGDRTELTAAEGHGPVNALDNAMRKVLNKFYPGLDAMRLVDFKVRVIDGRDATAAKVRVIIDSRDHEHIWSTIGVSTDIIEASWKALSDSFQYKLSKDCAGQSGTGTHCQKE